MRKKAIAMVWLLMVVLVLFGCGKKEEGKSSAEILASGDSEEMLNKNLEAAGLDNVEVSEDGKTISFESGNEAAVVGAGQSWPENMPEELPKVDFGTIYGSGTSATAVFVTVNLEYDEEEMAKDYLNAFVNSGWTKTYDYKDDMIGEQTVVFDNGEFYAQVYLGGGQLTITCDDVMNNPFAGLVAPDDSDMDDAEDNGSGGESGIDMGRFADESYDPPTRFPDFDYGMETGADPSMYPGAISVRVFIGVTIDDLIQYFIACNDEGFAVIRDYENEMMGSYKAVHSKTSRELVFEYTFDMESLTIVENDQGASVPVDIGSGISDEMLGNTVYGIVNTELGESQGDVEDFPEYDGYYQEIIDMDQSQVKAQKWNWAKEYRGVDYSDIARFLVECQDRGYLVELLIANDGISGMVRISHSSIQEDYGLLIGDDNTFVLISADK